MAKKISQLTQATEVKSDDVTVIVQDGETKKLPLNMMVTKQDIEDKKVAGLAKLDEIEATYENDTYTPTITVKNKSSVKVGEGDGVDYSANVMDGHAKSAILKGQTLVNVFQFTSKDDFVSSDALIIEGTTMKFNANGTYQNFWLKNNGLVKTNTDYLFIVDILENTLVYRNGIPDTEHILYLTSVISGSNDDNFFQHGALMTVNDLKGSAARRFIKKMTSNPTSTGTETLLTRSFLSPSAVSGTLKIKLMIIEYQEGMENWDIPYFEGMQSVKMPVLTTSNEDGTKTNILSTPEDVTLRGIGDVQDELDLLAGEVTERIVEFNFNQNYVNDVLSSVTELESVYRFSIGKIDGLNNNYVNKSICDRFKIANDYTGSYEHTYYWNGVFYFFIEKSKIEGTIDAFKTYITNNPIKFQTVLATPVIKTVDLMPSGTHPSTTPYCWKNGHIQLSSSGLLPNLEYSVVTSRAGQINQNAAMIVKNDKRIFDLEILLAGGLVNTTYQALTLQNQVETGLSKVSLNSETEPDYLLYHMIMKLIEEKAYKLDDLTEKVSVFYLYEKLSDEQFETIYSALYPFVEDEIVEEPVVEELPEVVEDEVIM